MARRKKNTASPLFTLLLAVVLIGCYIYSQRDPGLGETGPGSRNSQTRVQESANPQSFSATSGDASSQGAFCELPAPLTDRPEQVLQHQGFTVSFNATTLTPNWVAWELTASESKARGERNDDFQPDTMLPVNQQVTTQDYRGTGYDRGHMCPAADMKWSQRAQRECFLMSNICPQVPELNQRHWEKLESSCRRWARQEGAIYIVCGPIYKSGRRAKTIGRDHKVSIPDAFFKCVLSLRQGHEKAIGFIYTNTAQAQSMAQCAMTVDEVERRTGMDFFTNLPAHQQQALESTCNLTAWD